MTWAIARTPAGQEMYFAERLETAGQTAFVPTVTVVARIGSRRCLQKVQRARFPSYLFVKADTIQYLDMVYEDRRFRGFLKVAHQIHFVEDGAIRAIRAWKGYEVDIPPVQAAFAPGELLRVLEGICGGMKGEVMQRTDGIWLNGYDFPKAFQFTDLKNLTKHVDSAE